MTQVNTGRDLIKGQKYRVLKPAQLQGMKHLGGSAFGGTSHDLPIGSIIEYVGMKKGWGSDNIPLHNFKHEDFTGEFSPTQFYGYIIPGYLENE